MEPTQSSNPQDLTAMQHFEAGIKKSWSNLKRGVSENIIPPLEQKCNQAMLALKKSDVGIFANKSASTLQCHASRGLGELKDVASGVLDAGLGVLGFNTESKLSSEFRDLGVMHEQIKKGMEAKREAVQGSPEERTSKVLEFDKLKSANTELERAYTGAVDSKAKLDEIHKKLSNAKSEIRDAKREVGLAMVSVEQAPIKLKKARTEFKNAVDQKKPHTKEKEGAVVDAAGRFTAANQHLKDTKLLLEQKKETMRQLERDLSQAESEFSQRLQHLGAAIGKISEEAKIPVQRPLTTGDKVEAKLKEAKGKAEEAKDAAVRLAGKVAKGPVGTFVKEKYAKVEGLAEQIATKNEDRVAEQTERKHLSNFNRLCDAKISELEAKKKPDAPNFQNAVRNIVHAINDSTLTSLFNEYDENPSKENFEKLMKENKFNTGLAMSYGSTEEAKEAVNLGIEIARLKKGKATAETAFFDLQTHREIYRLTEAKYQTNQELYGPELEIAASNYEITQENFRNALLS